MTGSKLDIWNNSKSMNIPEPVTYAIFSDPYFKSLLSKKTYHEVIHAIEQEVTFVEPFIPNTGGSPSKALCLLFKFATLKLTAKQLHGLLRAENQFVRALGFVYTRFAVLPDQQLKFIESYMTDKTTFIPTGYPNRTEITMAQWIHELLIKKKWFAITMPRYPLKLKNDLAELVTKAQDELRKMGAVVQEIEDDADVQRHEAESEGPDVKKRKTNEWEIEGERLRDGRVRGQSTTNSDKQPSKAKEQEPNRREGDRSQDRERTDRDRDRNRDRGRDGDRERDRDRDRDGDRNRDRDRDRNRERDPERDGNRNRERDRERDRDRDGDKNRDRDRQRDRATDLGADQNRDREQDKAADRNRDPDRDRDRDYYNQRRKRDRDET